MRLADALRQSIPKPTPAGAYNRHQKPGLWHRIKPIVLLLLILLASFTTTARAQTHFGYAGVLCGLEAEGQDFATEVAPFTNIAHICPTGDLDTDAARLARAYELGMTPLYHVEPVFWLRDRRSAERRRTLDLWTLTLQTIEASGVPPEEIILYLFDEPSLVRVWPHHLQPVIERIQTDLPGARTMVIDAYRERHPPLIPARIDYWGFNMYTLRDPGADQTFMDHLERAASLRPPGVQLVLVLDGSYTPIHAEAGLSPDDMAEVALNYERLAARTDGVAMLLGYAWPGGIHWEDELGTRDLPQAVRATHQAIGRRITGR